MRAAGVALIAVTSLVTSSAFAATAFWTGRSEQTQTVTYKMVWKCEYNYNGQKFWRLFELSCPSQVDVE
jgi:hypothetical protein